MAFTYKLQDGTEYLLERNPSRKMFSEEPIDNTVKSKSDGGAYVMTHATTTRDVIRYNIVYNAIPEGDLEKILAVDDACGSSDWFYWTHPITEEIKQVRFDRRPKRRPPFVSRYRVDFILEEI